MKKEDENKIKAIYERRQKAHDELLACDIELDKILKSILSCERQRLREEIEGIAGRMKITSNSHPFHANFEPIKGHITGYNEAVERFKANILKLLE